MLVVAGCELCGENMVLAMQRGRGVGGIPRLGKEADT